MTKLLSMLFALALVAAACSGGDDGTTADTTATTAEEEESGPATTVAATTTTVAEAADGPVAGGTLVYGIEADSANPWAHYRVSCAIACHMILRSVTDPLFYPLEEVGAVGPHLIESWEANEDNTVHTWQVRDGVQFHDGTPLDAAAVAFNLNACRFSSLTGPALSGIADIQADGQTLTITTSSPWAPLVANFGGSTCSYMFSPAWLASLPDIPFRTEGAPFFSEEIAATPADGDPAAPVGTGAFVFESYTPGNGNSFVAVKNENYWRGPNGVTGESLPYLDKVEYVVAVDIASRSSALESGQFDIIHTSNADEIKTFQDDGEFPMITASDFGATSYILLNVAAGENPTLAFLQGLDAPVPMDPNGLNDGNPLVHLSCRRALAHATDSQRVADERGAGIVEVANGPFPPGSIGYLEDTGYPQFDIAAAQAEFETCKADAGTDVIQFTYNTTNDPFNVETNQLIASMWADAFGDEIQVTITPVEQGQYIGLALTGTFQAQGWRNHSGIDPDNQFLWWFSGTSSPVGSLALNFGRFQDPVIDENLVLQRSVGDLETRRAAAEAINRSFGENVWNIWNTWTLWGVPFSPNVQNVVGATTPEGDITKPVIGGAHYMSEIWCLNGDCQG